MLNASLNPVDVDRSSQVTEDFWAAAAIAALAEHHILPSAWVGQFQPNAPIPAAAFAHLLDRGQRARSTSYTPNFPGLGSVSAADDAPEIAPEPVTEEAALMRVVGIRRWVEQGGYLQPLVPDPVVETYFEDGQKVPPEARGAIAAATLAGLLVNYPDVRLLRPQAKLTWAEAIALLCQGLGLSGVPPQYVPWYATLDTWGEASVPWWRLRGNAFLVEEIQTHLQKVHLYPAKASPSGRFTLQTQVALVDFCQTLHLSNHLTYTLDHTLVQALLTVDPADFALQAARNRDRIFREYWQQEKGFDASHLAFLDQGIEGSPFEKQIDHYPIHLELRVVPPATAVPAAAPVSSPPGSAVPAPGAPSQLVAGKFSPVPPQINGDPLGLKVPSLKFPSLKVPSLQVPSLKFPRANSSRPNAPADPTTLPPGGSALCLPTRPYPQRGSLPTIDTAPLEFLHSDIQQACLCIGQFTNRQLQVSWLGRNALVNGELWSATKIIPLLHLVSQIHDKALQADIDNQVIRAGGRNQGFSVYDLAVDMVNYHYAISSSNALAAMFKLFSTPQTLESWIKGITGNTKLTFRGNYGEGPFIGQPVLWDKQLQKVVLQSSGTRHGGPNALSAYDMTRLLTMLAWHLHLPPSAQLPRAQWRSLESMVRAMGRDSARYVDRAIERLGLRSHIQSPVIISKLGFGYSGQRQRTELVYSAFVQFVDMRPQAAIAGVAPVRSFGMTLVGAKKLGDGNREATLLDARMAAEVTEILRRLMLDEWV